MQIGEVAARTGLSLRTIRHYEAVGLIVPAERSRGGFRLYTAGAVERLRLIKDMKPLDFPLEDIRGLLDVLDRTRAADPDSDERATLSAELASYLRHAQAKCAAMRAQLSAAEDFVAMLAGINERQRPAVPESV